MIRIKYLLFLLLLLSGSQWGIAQQQVAIPGDRAGDPETWVSADEALRYFILLGNVNGVKEAITKGANVNAYPLPLMQAVSGMCQQNNVAIVAYLLKGGASIDPPGDENPLCHAILNATSQYDVFLKEKMEMLILTPEQKTIHQQRYQEFMQVARLLLQKGANPNGRVPNSTADTPLKIAAGAGCLEAVKLLLQYKADVHAKLAGAPLMNEPAGGTIAWGMAANAAAFKARQAMGLAADTRSQATTFQQEVKKGQDKWPAIFNEYTEIVELLISKGAIVQVQYKGITPLQQALQLGIIPMAAALKAAGAR